MKSIDRIAARVGVAKKNTYNVNSLNRLREIGKEAIKRAYESKETEDDLYNQHDAYAYAIFFNGQLLEKGYTEPSESKGKANPYDGKSFTGREAADNFISGYHPPKRGLCLLICNGMFYSYLQETKTAHNAVRSYKILTQIQDYLDEEAAKFKGAKRYSTL